jgi:urea transporter
LDHCNVHFKSRVFFSSSSSSSASNNVNNNKTVQTSTSFLPCVSRGIGQVIFCNSPLVGGVIIGSLALTNPYLATLATLGCMTSTWTSNALIYTTDKITNGANPNAVQLLQQEQNDGLYGFNGCLVGCATAVFVAPPPLDPITTSLAHLFLLTHDDDFIMTMTTMSPILYKGIGTTIVASAFIPFVSAALKPVVATPYTLSFNLVTLTMLLHLQPFRPVENLVDVAATTTTTTTTLFDVADLLLRGTLSGISQIFVVDSILTGASLVMGTTLVLKAAAVAASSSSSSSASSSLLPPMAIGHMCSGALIGAATAAFTMNVPWNEISMGLWSYNPALTSLAIAVAVHPATTTSSSSSSSWKLSSLKVMALSSGGAFATTWVMGALQPIFAGWHTPCLTLPFCWTMCLMQWTQLLPKETTTTTTTTTPPPQK